MLDQKSAVFLLDFDDLIWAPICLLLLSILLYYKSKRYDNTPLKKYYLIAFYIRVLFLLFFTILSDYYFGFADTNHYYQAVLDMTSALADDFSNIRHIYGKFELTADNPLAIYFISDPLGVTYYYMLDSTNYIAPRFALPFSYIFSKSYLAICLCLSLWSFGGGWRIFKLFHKVYPHLEKKFAIACLFFPSILFWSVGLLKDTICFGAVGYIAYAAYRILYERHYGVVNLFILLFASFLLFTIKSYIFICLLMAFLLILFLRFRESITSRVIRNIASFFLVIAGVFLFFISLSYLTTTKESSQYSTSNILENAKNKQMAFQNSTIAVRSNFEGVEIQDNAYGAVFGVFLGFINTFYRPYFWDIRSVIMFFSFLEATLMTILTIMIFRKISFNMFFTFLISEPFLLFCFSFSFVFGGFIGISASNFGALSRYKIPAVPFFLVALILIMDKSKRFSPNYFFSKRFI